MSELKAVLFDVDGTLSETERYGHLVAMNEAFRTVGLDWHWSAELYGELLMVTGSTERLGHYVQKYQPEYRHINSNLDELIAEIVKHKNANYKRIAEAGEIPLRPGVERVLREIHDSDVRMGIATTTTPQNVDALLIGNIGGDVLDWFEVIAAGNIVPDKKPAPDIYTYALEKMDLQPEECLAIEDSENGVLSALAAGIPVLVIKSEYSDGHDLSGARLLVDEWGTPDSPMNVLSGDADGHAMITLDLMKKVHSAS
ncbi:MAG: HAD-IA family hydrolase [Gammaproteobacteria bacterium]|nr:HAD-IA family hydrolase [Gammaproteobacteria bacterium]